MTPEDSTRDLTDTDTFRVRQDGHLVHIAASLVRKFLQRAAPTIFASQIVTGSTALTSASPYRTIVNSAAATTQTLPAAPTADETRVIANVGAGTVTVSGTFRSGTTITIAQDNARTFAWNATLGYWTQE